MPCVATVPDPEPAVEIVQCTKPHDVDATVRAELIDWREVGRWPNALRLPDGGRDEVLMMLDAL